MYNRIRGVTPEPGAFTTVDDTRVKIIEAAIARGEARLRPGQLVFGDGRLLVGTGSEPLELSMVHPAGKKPMKAADWWRGRPVAASTVAE